MPPLRTEVDFAGTTLSLGRNAPVVVTIRWTLDTSRVDAKGNGIAVLRSIPASRNRAGIEIRDLSNRHQKTGTEYPEDFEVITFTSSQNSVERFYTLYPSALEPDVFATDRRRLDAGERYVVGVKKMSCAWVTREEVGEQVWNDERSLWELMLKEPRIDWQPDAGKEIQTVD